MGSPPLLTASPYPGVWVGGLIISSAYLLPLHLLPKLGPGLVLGGCFCGVPQGWEELGSPKLARV